MQVVPHRRFFHAGQFPAQGVSPCRKNYKKVKKGVDKRRTLWYNSSVLGKMLETLFRESHNGGIAQLARAIGSYPIGRGFKSNFRYHAWQSLCQMMQFAGICSGPLVKRLRHRPFTAVTGVRFSHGSPVSLQIVFWPVGQEAKTPPFHGGNGSSILPRVIVCGSTIMYCFFICPIRLHSARMRCGIPMPVVFPCGKLSRKFSKNP